VTKSYKQNSLELEVHKDTHGNSTVGFGYRSGTEETKIVGIETCFVRKTET
jgi:hypothetical protein